ncbi:Ig-like domain-containing protein, partial [Marinomonas communis]|uniref:Ig-like domain-containing protein n=1 Tax=Marinomonas communis TaxID=28254 RepID=UPI0013C3682C
MKRFYSKDINERIALERRWLFDGAMVATVDDVVDDESIAVTPIPTSDGTPSTSDDISDVADYVQGVYSNSLYIVDSSLLELDSLIASFHEDAKVLLLDPEQSGVSQVDAYLTTQDEPFDTIHILTHASAEGQFSLGSDSLSSETVENDFSSSIAAWAGNLTESADILIYGCDLASSPEGIATLETLNRILGADLAASDDLTGRDGDWELEHEVGVIESQVLSASDWNGNLVDLTLNLPSVPAFSEDQPLVFAELGGNVISVGGINGSLVEVGLSIPLGVGELSLTQTAGVDISEGNAAGDTALTLSGDIADINLALESLVYTPAEDYNGDVQITVALTDALPLGLHIATLQLPLTITAVDDIVADTVSTDKDTSANFNVMSNDEFESSGAVVTGYSTPTHGSVTINAQGDAVYTPDAGYTGTDSFTYTVTSGGTTEEATVSITVNEPNAMPQITLPTTASFSEDQTYAFSEALGTSIAVSDTDGDTLTVTLEVSNATMSLSGITGLTLSEGTGIADNKVVFSGTQSDVNAALDGLVVTPKPDYYGSDTLSVSVSDGTITQNSNIALVIAGIVDGQADSINTDTNSSVSFYPLSNDSFDSNAQITSVQGATNGTVSIGASNELTYTPNAAFRGTDTFTYMVTSSGVTEDVQVSVTVNTDPVSLGLDALSLQDGGVVLVNAALGFNDPDLGDVLVYSAVGLPSGLSIDPNTGLITGTLAADASTQVASGDYNVTVTATDLLGASATVELDINVVNPVPIVSAGVAAGVEDTELNISALVNASDPDGDDITITAATALNGTVTIEPDGSLNYVPNTNFNGIDTITYTVTDSDGASANGSIVVTVAAVADLPTISIPTIDLLTEDTPLIFANLVGQQISVGDVDGQVLDIKLSVPIGSMTINQTAGLSISEGDGVDDQIIRMSGSVADINVALNSLVYTPGEDYNGPVDLTVELGQLGQLLEVNAVLPIGISAVVDIVDDELSMIENQTITSNVLANDSFENEGRFVKSFTTPSFGVLTLNSSGDITYTPNTNFVGDDSFTYTVESNGTLETATVTITVSANQAPNAVADSATTNEDTSVVINVLANDTDPEGDAIEVVGASASNGTVTVDVNGLVTYSPNTNFNGVDSISYTLRDSDGNESTGVVTVNVTAVNDAPVASDDTAQTTDENAVLSTSVPVATDVDGTIDSYQVVTTVSEGSLTFNPDGSYSFDPGADFDDLAVGESRAVTFTYTATDNNGAVSSSKTVTITVTGSNDAPVVINDTATVIEDGGVTIIDVLSNDTDVDGDVLTIANATVPAEQGTVAVVDGKIQFTPAADFNGTATISYTVSDGTDTTAGSVAVTVTAVNDAPVASDDAAQTTDENAVLNTSVPVATDVDGTIDSYQVVTNVTEGSLTFNSNGSYSFDPGTDFDDLASGESRAVTFTYTATDNNGAVSAPKTVTITVTGANDAPVVVNDAASVSEDGGVIVIDVLANDSDVEGDSLSIANVTVPEAQGTVTIVDGKVNFTPAADFNGTATITYTVSDGKATTEGSVAVTVTAVNDAPVASDDAAQTTDENAVLNTSVPVATDVDGTIDSYQVVTNVTEGSLTFNSNGSYSFDPGTDFDDLASGESRAVTFTYTATDNNGAVSAPKTVTITI